MARKKHEGDDFGQLITQSLHLPNEIIVDVTTEFPRVERNVSQTKGKKLMF